MLPFGAQGANQAIEDAGALGALFTGDVCATDVAQRLTLFEDVRRLRASRVQTLSRVRLGKEKEVEAQVKQYADPPGSCKCLQFIIRLRLCYGVASKAS
jgi:salicylate hydroxylase